jgi:hypothetical protein
MVVGHGPARCASGRPAWETPVRRRGANSEGPGGAGGWTGGGAGESGSMAAAVSAGDRGSGAVFPAGRNETPPPVTSRRRGLPLPPARSRRRCRRPLATPSSSLPGVVDVVASRWTPGAESRPHTRRQRRG